MLEDGSLELEVLHGTSKEDLLNVMKKCAKERNKKVQAVSNKGEKIVIKPDDVADLDQEMMSNIPKINN